MNAESQVLVTESVNFPMPEQIASEKEMSVESKIKISTIETKNNKNEVRFARLKKSLRKRSADIL